MRELGSNELNSVPVQVGTTTIQKLFDTGYSYGGNKLPIRIDTYQRDYVWSVDKVNQLIRDIKNHKKQPNLENSSSSIQYYLGSLLFHKKTGEDDDTGLYIIDGQQRLTTLTVLWYLTEKQIPGHLELTFESDKSRKNIKIVQEEIDKKDAQTVIDFLKEIDVTVIITDSEDQAFSFFDSQNTRGVRLSTTDLLKSYHLRMIGSKNGLQENAAKRWEKLQSREKILLSNPKKDPAFELIERFLWRIRNWSRNNFKFEQWESVLNEFENNREQTEEYKLFPGPGNLNYHSLAINDSEDIFLKRPPLTLDNRAKNFPILIQQPLYNGFFFFLYSERYSEILESLKERSDDSEKYNKPDKSDKEFIFEFLNKNEHNVSYYLKELLVIVLLAYVDRFGWYEKYRDDFLQLTMLWFLQSRLERANFRKRSPMKMLKKINLLALIERSYDSRDLVETFKSALINQNFDENGDSLPEELDGIQERYFKSVKELFQTDLEEYQGKEWEKIYKHFPNEDKK